MYNPLIEPVAFLYNSDIVDEFKAIRLVPGFMATKKFISSAFPRNNFLQYTPNELFSHGLNEDKSLILYDNALIDYLTTISTSTTLGNMTNAQLDGLANYINGYAEGTTAWSNGVGNGAKYIIIDSEGGRNGNNELIWDTTGNTSHWDNFVYLQNKLKNTYNKICHDLIGNRYGIFMSGNGGRINNDYASTSLNFSYTSLLAAYSNPSSVTTYFNSNVPYTLDDLGYNSIFGGTVNASGPNPATTEYKNIEGYMSFLSYPLLLNRVVPTIKYHPYCWMYNDRYYPYMLKNRYKLKNSLKGTPIGPIYNGYIESSPLPAWSSKLLYQLFFWHFTCPNVDFIDTWSAIDKFFGLKDRAQDVLHQGANTCGAQGSNPNNYTGNDYPCGEGQGYGNTQEIMLEELVRASYRFHSTQAKDICNGTQVHETYSFDYKRTNMTSFATINNPNDNSECVRSFYERKPFLTIWYNAALNKRLLLFQDPFSPVNNKVEFRFTINGILYERETMDNELYVEII